MKIKVYITSHLFFLVGMKINAQNEIHVDTISFCYFNGITKQAQNINEIQVTNNSSEDYLTWISLMPINKKSNNDLIYDFFKKRKGNFNWIEMMYDNLLNKRSTCIGYSFVKTLRSVKLSPISFPNQTQNFMQIESLLSRRRKLKNV